MQVSKLSSVPYINFDGYRYSRPSINRASRILQKNVRRVTGLNALKESVANKKLTFFQKIGYFMHKVKIYLDTI